MGKLRPCPSCNREVSLQAAACPGCGHQFQPTAVKGAGGFNITDPVHLVGLIVMVLFVAGVAAYVWYVAR